MIIKTKSRIALFTLSFILFVTCFSISLNASGYVLTFGWKPSTQKTVQPEGYTGNYGICDRALIEKGFPLTFMRPYDDASDCTDQYNVLAIVFDVLVALGTSLSTSWIIIKIARKTNNK